MVSVIVPLYNHERYIPELIRSVVQSSYTDIELLVCDDASTDNSFVICQSELNRADCKSVLIKNNANQGVSATLNKLLGMAKGEFILPVASDDVLTHHSILSRVSFLFSRPDIDLVIGDCDVIGDGGGMIREKLIQNKLKVHFGIEEDILINRSMLINWCMPGSVMMYRSALLDKVYGYNEAVRQEDYDFFLRTLVSGKISYIPFTVLLYRKTITEGNDISKNNIRLTMENLKVSASYLKKIGMLYKVTITIRIAKLSWGLARFLASYLWKLFN